MLPDKANFVLDKVRSIDTLLIDYLAVGLFYTDAKGKCLYVNKKWTDITGVTLEQASGDGWINAVHVDDRNRIVEEWLESVNKDQQFISEYRF